MIFVVRLAFNFACPPLSVRTIRIGRETQRGQDTRAILQQVTWVVTASNQKGITEVMAGTRKIYCAFLDMTMVAGKVVMGGSKLAAVLREF